MLTSANDQFPYSRITASLVRSVMRAQSSVITALSSKKLLNTLHHAANRHFCWVAFNASGGYDRHLYEGRSGHSSLLTERSRGKSKLPSKLRECLLNMEADTDPETQALLDNIATSEPTRISSLIIASVLHVPEYPEIRSPLAVVYDYLTDPDSPGSEGYALMACRNCLFAGIGIVPDLLTSGIISTFSASDIDDAMSVVWTSVRDRFHSRGKDKLPSTGRRPVDSLTRHFLAMKDVLTLRFLSFDRAVKFLNEGNLMDPVKAGARFEFSKGPGIERLPEVAEIVNELWGVPLPIRGAEVIFKGGLKFSARGGLVVVVHGGAGSGKTSLALGLSALIAPYGIETIFLTGEESEKDLQDRVRSLVPSVFLRLGFFSESVKRCLSIKRIALGGRDGIEDVIYALSQIKEALEDSVEQANVQGTFLIPKPCRAMIVLDGLHDFFAQSDQQRAVSDLYALMDALRSLRALVVITSGEKWFGEVSLDYLVDVAVRLSFVSIDQFGMRPDRRVILTKARHQFCAPGTHGFQVGGDKGIRFSPQIGYQMEKRALWRPLLPDRTGYRVSAMRSMPEVWLAIRERSKNVVHGYTGEFRDSRNGVQIYERSHVFINGVGSGGKAAFAVKLAISPTIDLTSVSRRDKRQRVLIVSFLYPSVYYEDLVSRLHRVLLRELHSSEQQDWGRAHVVVMQLYPGHLKPNDLFNRIHWALDAAEGNGLPYTSIVIDGIHNVFLQFPEIEAYRLFWPQLFSALRRRDVMTIVTHTTLEVPYKQGFTKVDDDRSEPLRHALVQKTDFQIEIDPWQSSTFRQELDLKPPLELRVSDLFVVKVASAIGQRVPSGILFWSREDMVLLDLPKGWRGSEAQAELPLV